MAKSSSMITWQWLDSVVSGADVVLKVDDENGHEARMLEVRKSISFGVPMYHKIYIRARDPYPPLYETF